MNKTRWQYLKDLTLSTPRMVHKSCDAGMVPDPRSAVVGFNLPPIPYVERPGHTYNAGRNAAKRHDRKADIRARAAARRSA